MDGMTAPVSHRWARLSDDLAAIGLLMPVETCDGVLDGTVHSMELNAGGLLIVVCDKWAHSGWAGWQVHTEGATDGLVKQRWPITKRRNEVVEAVRVATGRLS